MPMRLICVCAPAAILAAAGTACAQPCQPTWDTTVGNPGVPGGYVAPMLSWNDGGGERLYVGSSDTPWLSKWNSANNTWSPVGAGISQGFTNAFMTSMVVFNPGSGDRLVVGGFYDTAGGTPNTASLAMWNGSSWEALGTGWTGSTRQSVWSMAKWNGRLYIGGGVVNQPPLIAGQPWSGMASWNGQTWQTHISSIVGFSPTVFAMRVFNDGSGEALFVAGRFTAINGTSAANVARFDGVNWTALAGGLPTSQTGDMEAMTVFQGKLHVGGSPTTPAGQPQASVASWDGQGWTSVGQSLGGRTTALAVFNDGTGDALYAGGTAQPGVGYIAKLVAGQWVMVDGGVDASVFGMNVVGNRLYIGGSFLNVNGQPSKRIVARVGCPTCYADCNGDGVLGLADFGCFQTKFALGCP
jgi:hypothetical protein